MRISHNNDLNMFKSHLELETQISHTRCKGNGMVLSFEKTKVIMIEFIAE